MSTNKKKNGIAVAGVAFENLAVASPGRRRNKQAAIESVDAGTPAGIRIPLDLIDYSPFNHRKYINPRKLEELSASIAKLDVIEDITVRVVIPGRYELAVGERRVRAAKMAGLKDIPANIRVLTDEQVIEMQLAENFERQDPHFMEEAFGIAKWIELKRPLQEVAARMGRPDRYVYDRVKLLDLIDPIQEMAMADCFNFTESLAIAAISQSAQESLYETHCKTWKDTPHFKLSRLDYILSTYHCSLPTAKFDIRDETLVPAMGACITCQLNTACITSMFPEEEAKAKCTKRSCFEEKTKTSFFRSVADFVDKNNITAFLSRTEVGSLDKDVLDYLAAQNKPLDLIDPSSITEIHVPREPTKEQFTRRVLEHQCADDDFEEEGYFEDEESDEAGYIDNDYDDYLEDGDDDDEYDDDAEDETEQSFSTELADPDSGGEAEVRTEAEPVVVFNEEGYNNAMDRYRERLADHEAVIAEFPLQSGLRLGYNQSLILVTFIKRPRPAAEAAGRDAVQLTSKEVQQAIKEGKATPAMLDGELKRSQQWIQRKEEIDAEKAQKTIYEQLRNKMTEDAAATTITGADIVGRRWFLYQGLSYSDQGLADSILFPHVEESQRGGPTRDDFKNLTDDQEGILIKLAVLGRDRVKDPTDVAGEVLYQMALAWVDVPSIEAKYEAGAEKRRSNHRERTRKLQTIIADLDPDRPKVLPAWATSLAVTDCETLDDFLQKYLIPEAFSAAAEDVRERALYSARQELKVHGFASIDPTKSSTTKMVVFIPTK